MITIQELADLVSAQLHNAQPALATQVEEIGLDSQQLPEGAVFAALPGLRTHGAKYALDTDALAVLTDAAGTEILQAAGFERPILEVPNVRAVLGTAAAAIYDHPSEKLTVIGVTGTSGKTTTSYFLEAGLLAAGCSVGLIGTTGTRINREPVPTSLTTPEAPTLQRLFRDMAAAGVTHVVMEVSSHALSLGRVQGTKFAVAAFTNLSQDHLDFHHTMEEYFAAKALLFTKDSPVHAPRAVICINDAWGEQLVDLAAGEVRTVSTTKPADIYATDLQSHPNGSQDFHVQTSVDIPGITTDTVFHLAMPGSFNVANALVAIATAGYLGLDAQKEAQFIAALGEAYVPGRMQRIPAEDFLVVVDYAHKPGAVTAVLETIRQEIPGRIVVVIGAGGNRDAAKRPLMGAEAAKVADYVIVTDDNPRDEDPAEIRQAVLAGVQEYADTEVSEIGNREAAIARAITWAQAGDAVVILGKGHEVGQLIKGVNHHFDDREVAAAEVAKREGR